MSESENDFAYGIDTELLDRLGRHVYGDQWPTVRAHNVKRLKGDDPAPLRVAEYNRLLNGLRILDEMRKQRERGQSYVR